MDRMIRKFSMGLAKSSSRRDFLSMLGRGVVSAGMGTAFLFGGQRLAYADICVFYDSSPNHAQTCYNDVNGCGGTYCSDVQPDACLNGVCNYGPYDNPYWRCCCLINGVNYLSTCSDCWRYATDPHGTCVCIWTQGPDSC